MNVPRVVVLTFLAAAALVGISCDREPGRAGTSDKPTLAATIELRSEAFADGAAIPERFSCEGENVSPPLEWSKLPDGAAELALVMSDPDAPDGTFYHWVVLGIDPSATSIGAGEVPPGAVVGQSSSGMATYIGMCPPDGSTHRYLFTLYALNRQTKAPAGIAPAAALAVIEEAAVAVGRLHGIFGR